MEGVVPHCFRCPISLEPMADPVSLCTGVSYERSNIERWLSAGHKTCPITCKDLDCLELTPNRMLRSLISQWRDKNKHSKRDVSSMIEEVESAGSEQQQLRILKSLKSMARQSARNSRCIGEAEDAIPVLASILTSTTIYVRCREESLGILVLLPMSSTTRRILASNKKLIDSVCSILCKGSDLGSRVNAATLLETLVGTERDLKLAVGGNHKCFAGLVELLNQQPESMAVKASLRALMCLCSSRRNRVLAVECGVMEALVDILPRIQERSTCENALAIVEIVCQCAEGRAELGGVRGGISAIGGKIGTVSGMATESAVRTLWLVCTFSSDEGIQRRVVEEGRVVEKLLLMLQKDFSSRTKHEMGDLLKLLCNIREHCPDVLVHDRIEIRS